MRETGVGRKVYSPDVKNYSLEGMSGIYGTVASLFVGPIRLLLRVMHNLMILPVGLLKSYSSGLLFVGIVMEVLGIIDYVAFHKWPLFVSQIPIIVIAIILNQRVARAEKRIEKIREVEIDVERVEELCGTIYDELDNIVGKEVIEDGQDSG